MRAQLTLITSTSYKECGDIPIFEFVEFYDNAVELHREMNEVSGGDE